MARQKKKQDEIKTDGWLTTFSDMVTLLFCFFVLLYAMASTDETKMQYIFQTFQSGGEYLNLVVKEEPEEAAEGTGSTIPGSSMGETTGGGSAENDFEELLNYIIRAAAGSAFSDSIEVDGTSGQIRIKFDNDVLFDSDSYTLKESGRRAISVITPGLKTLQECIGSVQVQGHTADINDINQISPINDWDLSSLRAAAVIKYMDYQKVVTSEKFLSEGYAQYKPIVSNETVEGRAENRRVEILVTRKTDILGSELFGDIMKYDYNQHHWEVDSEGNKIIKDKLNTPDVIQQILDSINERHTGTENGTSPTNEQAGPSVANDMISIPDSAYLPVESTAETQEAAPEETESTDEEA